MKNVDLMIRIGNFLRSVGLRAVVPEPDDSVSDATPEACRQSRRAASRRHMDRIRDSETAAVLVVNVDRPGALNYVGPNAFAEIGVAVSDDKLVFLLEGMPDSYAEDLDAWEVKCLRRDVLPLLTAFSIPDRVRHLSAWRETLQSMHV